MNLTPTLRPPAFALAALCVLACALALGACRKESEAEERAEERERFEKAAKEFRAAPKTPLGPEDREGLYALGALLGTRVAPYALAPAELAEVERGFADAARARKLALEDPDLEAWGTKVDELLKKRSHPELAAELAKGRKFAAAEAALPGAERLASGVVVRTIAAGKGPLPGAADLVRVAYRGTVAGGDAPFDERADAELPLGRVIPCWNEALPRLAIGTKARLVCPPETAYGDQGRPPKIAGGATLAFDVEILGARPAPR
ncbi:MAG: FKBP-type peptidyl-prolyl cis-trans isomerase [Anaeromyxobacteraceae bacterium]